MLPIITASSGAEEAWLLHINKRLAQRKENLVNRISKLQYIMINHPTQMQVSWAQINTVKKLT